MYILSIVIIREWIYVSNGVLRQNVFYCNNYYYFSRRMGSTNFFLHLRAAGHVPGGEFFFQKI